MRQSVDTLRKLGDHQESLGGNMTDALILAAGWGTRLKPLTFHRPKVLIPFKGKPLLEHWIDALQNVHVSRIFVNVHALEPYFEIFTDKYRDTIFLLKEPCILGSGGAIFNALQQSDSEYLLVVNGDTLIENSYTVLERLMAEKADGVSMVFSGNALPHQKNVLISTDGRVLRFRTAGKKPNTKLVAYTGIQLIHADIFHNLNWDGSFIDIIEFYNALIDQKAVGREPRYFIRAFCFNDLRWHDLGEPLAYFQAHFSARNDRAFFCGKNVSFGKNVKVFRSIIWDGVKLMDSTTVESCIVCDGVTLKGAFSRKIITQTGIYPLY
ncbi:MAG: NTP transferase domain-containing protein [Deltaproteobacteria bacterium]|nr:NTP transferase domain-containing protein [Deltaproteobacteria bacterium]